MNLVQCIMLNWIDLDHIRNIKTEQGQKYTVAKFLSKNMDSVKK